jgi:uncharacterized Fe-S center protein
MVDASDSVPEVHFLPADPDDGPYRRGEQVLQLFERLRVQDRWIHRGRIALKVQVGERGRPAPLAPAWLAPLARRLYDRGLLPFYTDTCSLYRGELSNAVTQLRHAAERGFVPANAGAVYLVADGVGGEAGREVDLADPNLPPVAVAAGVAAADGLVVLSHCSGHLQAGFGGAIVSLGHGLVPRAAKLRQTEALKPKIDSAMCAGCGVCLEVCNFSAIGMIGGRATIDHEQCSGCGQCMTVCYMEGIRPDMISGSPLFQQRIAEHALGVVADKAQRCAFFNFLIGVTPNDAAVGQTESPLFPDIGILAGTDPLAVDQAALDLIASTTGRPLPSWIADQPDPEPQLVHAERIGLGSRRYALHTVGRD